MAQKEYLKMDCLGGFNSEVPPERFNYALTAHKATLAAHAISSHDDLVYKLQLAESTLNEVERVLAEASKNGNYDFDDLLAEVTYAINRIGED